MEYQLISKEKERMISRRIKWFSMPTRQEDRVDSEEDDDGGAICTG